MKPILFFFVGLWLAGNCFAREIPPSEVFATVEREGFKHISSGKRIVENKIVEEDYASAMSAINKVDGKASNIFLVDAKNINDAVKATSLVIIGYLRADKPMRPKKGEGSGKWLVVYLGRGHSSPLKWKAESVKVDEKTIRFTYREPEAGAQSGDIVKYYYWVPIGELDSGAYNLELHDSGLKKVTLSRRVEVTK